MNPRSIWQISGGPATRSYADVFLRHGVALLGPGDPGPWSQKLYDYDFSLQGFIGGFAERMASGDALVLRTSQNSIRAIGIVADGYEHLHTFDDVNGWDLQHCRRIRWFQLPGDYVFDGPVFGATPSRFSRVQNPAVVDYVTRFLGSPPTDWQSAPLPKLPAEEPPLHEIPEELRAIVGEAHDYVALIEHDGGFTERPAEDETIAHFVVPLLKTLGWPAERIAIKWRNIDVSLFITLPRTPANCHLVIEAKRVGAGVEGALDQAMGYVRALGVPRDVMVTDGIRYRMYSATEDFAPIAYANLIRLKQSSLRLFERLKRP